MPQQEKKDSRITLWLKAKMDTLRQWYNSENNYLRLVHFPGTKLPFFDVLIDFTKFFTKGRTTDRAAGVAFNFFLALFPLILFFFTLVPYIPIPNLYDRLMLALDDFLIPSGTMDYVKETVDSIMNQSHDGLLSLSVVLCLVFGSSGIVAIFNGFRNVYANFVVEKDLGLRGWLVQRAFAIIMLIILSALIVVSVLLISLGGTFLHYMVTHEIIEGGSFTYFLFGVLRWVIGVFALCFGIALLYYFGNITVDEHYRVERNRKGPHGETLYRDFVIFSPGALLATALFVLGTVGFNIYISNFSRYNVLYGSIGTLIILLMWIWIVAILILAGNDLNSSIRHKADQQSEGEDNIRRREIVIEDLKRHINACQKANEVYMEKINEAKKTIEEQNVIIQNLEEQVKNNDLIIKAYSGFIKFEKQKAAEPYEPSNVRTEVLKKKGKV